MISEIGILARYMIKQWQQTLKKGKRARNPPPVVFSMRTNCLSLIEKQVVKSTIAIYLVLFWGLYISER